MKNLSTEEYFRLTVQDALEQGLLNIALVHPANPIKFLGNFLIEKSKQISALQILYIFSIDINYFKICDILVKKYLQRNIKSFNKILIYSSYAI